MTPDPHKLASPVRHDDGQLEEAFVSSLYLKSRYQRMLSGGTQTRPSIVIG